VDSVAFRPFITQTIVYRRLARAASATTGSRQKNGTFKSIEELRL